MSDLQRYETDPKAQQHQEQEIQQMYDYDPNRPRPMTTADNAGSNPRNQGAKQGIKGYNSIEKFPAVEPTHHRANSASSNPYRSMEKLQSPNSRKQSGFAIRIAKFSELMGSGDKNQSYALHSTRLIQSPSGDFARIKPKNIPQDKERLYEETLHLKQTVNGLEEDNLKLRTKVVNLEKEATKFERMIQDANSTYYKDQATSRVNENYLSISLKHNIKELKNMLKKKEEELNEMKRVTKFTKIQELETQTRAFQEETARLRTIIDHIISEKANIVITGDDKNRLQEEYFIQATQLKTLKKDNEEMATAIKILEEQNFEYEVKS